MGKRGPAPKATVLRLLDGNPGKRPLPKNEPVPSGEIGDPPDHLAAEAQAKWREIVASAAPGLLTLIDRSALEAFCTAWALHRQATLELQEKGGGPVIEDPKGRAMRNPWVMVLNQQAQIMAQYSSKFGLTPGDRVGLGTPGAGDPLSARQRAGLLWKGKIGPEGS